MASPGFLSARRVDGVLLLDKPVGITSNTAMQRTKRLLCAAKAGHVGTLDPLASGLLPLCFGEATKFSSKMFLADKIYVAKIALGVTTTTGDAEGEVTGRSSVQCGLSEIAPVLQKFIGEISQTPPAYSAIKLNGKPLYAYARAGEKVTVKPRAIQIFDLELLDYHAETLNIRLHCSSGTYVRALAEDIGRMLGCGAMLAALRRIAVGPYDQSMTFGIDAIEAMALEHRKSLLLPVDSLVGELPVHVLQPSEVQRIIIGQACPVSEVGPGPVRLYDAERRFLGVGEVLAAGTIVPRRLLATDRSAAIDR